MTPDTLRRLSGLAEARRARDLALLDNLLSRDRALQAEIAALGRTLAEDAAAQLGAAPLPPAQLALRQAWVDQSIRAAERQRAALAPGIAAARAVAVRSLGKHRALEDLVDRGDKEARHHKATRAEREAPPAQPQRPD